MKIALLEDDVHMAKLVQLWLLDAGYEVALFATGEALIEAIPKSDFDLLIIDWVLPKIQGDEVLCWVRGHLDWPIPILFVTQRDCEADIVQVLELGADDYMPKPVSQPLLLVRVKALLRRSGQCKEPRHSAVTCPPYEVDHSHHQILKGGSPVELTQKEYELAVFLFNHLGHVVSRGAILKRVWGFSSDINTRTVDTHVSRLRRKLGFSSDSGVKLSAIYQHGYRLERIAPH